MKFVFSNAGENTVPYPPLPIALEFGTGALDAAAEATGELDFFPVRRTDAPFGELDFFSVCRTLFGKLLCVVRFREPEGENISTL